jgi:hypothetical protein
MHRVTQLQQENLELKAQSAEPEVDPVQAAIQSQLQGLLVERSRLAEENARLARENAGLQVRRLGAGRWALGPRRALAGRPWVRGRGAAAAAGCCRGGGPRATPSACRPGSTAPPRPPQELLEFATTQPSAATSPLEGLLYMSPADAADSPRAHSPEPYTFVSQPSPAATRPKALSPGALE